VKNTLKLILLLFSLISFSQEQTVELNSEETEYNDFMNYEPKLYISTLNPELKEKFDFMELNSLASFKLFYSNQEYFQLNSDEIKEIEDEINQLVVALFLENKPVIIKKVGGYDGCPEEMIYKDYLNGKEITILNLCFTCMGATEYENRFIEIVNNRSQRLLH